MINKIICIFLFSCFLFANDNVEIDQIIEQINKAPLNERYIEMNKLKRLLKTKNTQFRQEVLIKLQTSISQNNVNDNNHIDVKDSSLEMHKGKEIGKDIKIGRDLKIDNNMKINDGLKHPPKPNHNDIKTPDVHKRNSISTRNSL